MKSLSSLCLFFVLLVGLSGQIFAQELSGVVTFTTSQNVYVKFPSTAEIQVGDTLSFENNPCLIVSTKSSTSCVCTRMPDCNPAKGAQMVHRPKAAVIEPKEAENQDTSVPLVEDPPTSDNGLGESDEPESRQRIRGRATLSSYNNISATRDNRNRFMARLSLNADNINDSDFSFETFLNYRQIIPANPEVFEVQTRYFRVYNLALSYTPTPDWKLTLGRKINQKIASLGAIDGLQVEKAFGQAYVGAIVGSRPDINSFALNLNLLQYGGYAGYQTNSKQFYSQSTIGLLQQQNGGKIDRRYAYLQHASTISRKLSLFASAELDLYSAVNGVVTNDPRLTNLFTSATYRFNSKINLMVSYDSRRRVLFYETFLTEIERLLQEDLARQGLRARINIRPIKYVNLGFSYARRFQADLQNKSDNIFASASWTRIPAIGGRLALTYNQNISNYLNTSVIAARYSRPIIKNKLDGDVYYRNATYRFGEFGRARVQQYVGVNLSANFNKKLRLGLSSEASFFNDETNYRVYARLSRRISGK